MPPAATVCTSDSGRQRERREVEAPAAHAEAESREPAAAVRRALPADASGRRSDSSGVRATAPCWIRKPASRASAEASARPRPPASAERHAAPPGRRGQRDVGLGEHRGECDAGKRRHAGIGRVARCPLRRELLAEREQALELEAPLETREQAPLRAGERIERRRRVEQQGERGEIERHAPDPRARVRGRSRGRSGTR